jgi:hypothetical protein
LFSFITSCEEFTVKGKGYAHMPAKKPHILTADDDPQMLRLVSRNLEL